jgi:hypothetical protein
MATTALRVTAKTMRIMGRIARTQMVRVKL